MEQGGNGEEGYMDNIVEDLSYQVQGYYIVIRKHAATRAEAIEELARVFELSIEEIEQLLQEDE